MYGTAARKEPAGARNPARLLRVIGPGLPATVTPTPSVLPILVSGGVRRGNADRRSPTNRQTLAFMGVGPNRPRSRVQCSTERSDHHHDRQPSSVSRLMPRGRVDGDSSPSRGPQRGKVSSGSGRPWERERCRAPGRCGTDSITFTALLRYLRLPSGGQEQDARRLPSLSPGSIHRSPVRGTSAGKALG